MKDTKKVVNFALFLIFVLVVIAIAERIGYQSFALGSFKIGLLPLVFAILITMLLGIKLCRKGILKRVYSEFNVNFAGKYLIFIMLPLMARYGADVAPKIREILSVGWVFIIQEIGNLGTVLIGLPIAILIGLKREAIGATLGIGREGELAYISEKYTLDSDEGRGVLSLYIIGTLFGTIIFSILAPLLLGLGFSVEALAMSSGVGSASMMTAASSALVAQVPEKAETIRAYASASQLLTSFLGTYTMVFLAVPLQRFMYNKMMKRGSK
ncbi:hypothetical protein PMSD_22565 [Paenibacillus macquariensis subsp. defensor]|uniref:DUF3100 domain-containing protein n=1 Tax=Paenibacillus macquariensis TaxID=948756 RepID=A0ABY1JPU0_9BACL|nr:DUF3100 domain-containing protein [Paenibacillus macquariensis]MEC0094040.1 DUF3100 domain-containing protein [Paenibacillus macquariensis]OAB28314.1 hypothetical protein PMSD_22565 [Paenibacillus macquariensis subsp. defensor]OAB37506.1 hypothetical protein PMSM_05445 [Paenibacillus macquariensis subsp. macquariensis]SIQ54995.1 Protein of unknown function [Paenibacillus macquariensis]